MLQRLRLERFFERPGVVGEEELGRVPDPTLGPDGDRLGEDPVRLPALVEHEDEEEHHEEEEDPAWRHETLASPVAYCWGVHCLLIHSWIETLS